MSFHSSGDRQSKTRHWPILCLVKTFILASEDTFLYCLSGNVKIGGREKEGEEERESVFSGASSCIWHLFFQSKAPFL